MKILVAIIGLLVCASAANAEWAVATSTDALDAKAKSTYAYVRAKRTLQQRGHEVRATLFVKCLIMPSEAKGELFATIEFSERVTIGERVVRWRVDDNPVSWKPNSFLSSGDALLLRDLPPVGEGEQDKTIPQLRQGKSLRVEADLPWAGKSLLEFNVTGAAVAFSKLTCRPVI